MKLTNAELKRIVELADFILEGEEMPQDFNELLAWGKSYLQDVDAWTPQNTRKVFMWKSFTSLRRLWKVSGGFEL